MGMTSGAMSVSRFRIIGAPKKYNLNKLSELISPHQVWDLNLEGNAKEERIGWVRPPSLDQVDLPPHAFWDMSQCEVDGGFLLRLRLERRSVPAQLLQLLYKERFFAISEEKGKVPPPKERSALKEELKAKLMARALPTLSYIDGFWRTDANELVIFTSSKKGASIFEKLFITTFASGLGFTLVKLDPPLLAITSSEWNDSKVATDALGRLSLATPVAFAQQAYP